MKIRILAISCTLAILTNSCTTPKTSPLSIDTTQYSPVQIHVYAAPDPLTITQVLLLPPLGVSDPALRDRMQNALYSAAQRRFSVPIRMIRADSAYAPYVAEDNLICNDGTLNLNEISIIGNLMDTTYIICPYIRELKVYHPQRIDIQITVMNAEQSRVTAELSSVFDAKDTDTVAYFLDYSRTHKNTEENDADLAFQIKSPAAFQGFVAEACSSVLAERLPF